MSGALGVIGAGYLNALLSGDTVLQADFVASYPPDKLREAIDTQLLIMARRIAVDADRTVEQVGEDMLQAAQLRQQVGI